MLPRIADPRPHNPGEFLPSPGDVLFRSHLEPDGISEHVVFLYSIDGEHIFSIGLPESGEGRLTPVPSSLNEWLIRARAIDTRDAEAMMNELAANGGEDGHSGGFWYYHSKFIFFADRAGFMQTNCMGLVVSALYWNGLETVPSTLGFDFSTELLKPVRSKPTIGHLARALTGTVALPYAPGKEEAIMYASCRTTHVEAQNGTLP